jgi:hypothetical protein
MLQWTLLRCQILTTMIQLDSNANYEKYQTKILQKSCIKLHTLVIAYWGMWLLIRGVYLLLTWIEIQLSCTHLFVFEPHVSLSFVLSFASFASNRTMPPLPSRFLFQQFVVQLVRILFMIESRNREQDIELAVTTRIVTDRDHHIENRTASAIQSVESRYGKGDAFSRYIANLKNGCNQRTVLQDGSPLR